MASHNIGLLTTYDIKKWKVQLQSFMASRESAKGSLKQQRLKVPKLMQLYKVLNK
jgi:hypothetical protein